MAEEHTTPKTIRIKRDICQRILNSHTPLFFFNKSQNGDNADSRNQTVWIPENGSIVSTVNGQDAFKHPVNGVAAVYIKPLNNYDSVSVPDIIEVEYEELDPLNYNHIKNIFLLYLYNSQDINNKYACRELLWYLNNCFLAQEILIRVLEEFDNQNVRPFFISKIGELAHCLSKPRQEIIKNVIVHFDGTYTIYCPTELTEAIETVAPNFKIDSAWDYNLFDLVHKATISPISCSYDVLHDSAISNFFLKVRRWLVDEEYSLTDYLST